MIAVAEWGRDSARDVGKFSSDWVSFEKQLKRLSAGFTLKLCYEAGPTGFELHRRLVEAGDDKKVVEQTRIERKPGERIKTDRRDAAKLARCLRAGDLTAVYVPDEDTEALRDLERARDAAKKAETAPDRSCGIQPANIRLIHRRSVARHQPPIPVKCKRNHKSTLDRSSHIRVLSRYSADAPIFFVHNRAVRLRKSLTHPTLLHDRICPENSIPESSPDLNVLNSSYSTIAGSSDSAGHSELCNQIDSVPIKTTGLQTP